MRIVASCLLVALVGASSVGLAALGCSTSSTPAPTGPGGGPVTGASDHHCTVPSARVQVTNPASCHPDAGPPSETGPSADADAASEAGDENPYGPTMFNAEADDDDCKYHMKFSVTPTHKNEDETFTLTVTKLADKSPLTKAGPRAEVYLNDTHPAPNTDQRPVEISPGTYTVGPLRFDASGRWTVRFHVDEDCSDLTADSPHGHAAFFVDVP